MNSMVSFSHVTYQQQGKFLPKSQWLNIYKLRESAARYEVKKNHSSAEQGHVQALIKALLQHGCTVNEIARRVGVSVATVRQWQCNKQTRIRHKSLSRLLSLYCQVVTLRQSSSTF